MKAQLDPIDAKYYTTNISLIDECKRSFLGQITIHVSGSEDFNPSDRELADCGMTREEWERNKMGMYPDEWTGEPVGMRAREACFFESCHTETQESYDLAKKIVSMINGD